MSLKHCLKIRKRRRKIQVQTTDVLIRVKSLFALGMALSGRSLESKAFDLVMRSVYSNMWVLIDPASLSQKVDEVPKQQVTQIIEALGKYRMANVYKHVADDSQRTCYLVMLNPKYVVHTCRRVRNIYIMHKLCKSAKHISGDNLLVDATMCGSHWENKCILSPVNDGEVHVVRYSDMHLFKWVVVC